MTLAHNLILRNLNAIYLQALGVKQPSDIADLLTLSQIWWESVHHHHSMEETTFFPDIEEYSGERGIMEVNIKQHAAFEAGVEQFRVYVFEQATPETYDGKKLREILEGFGPVLTQHLTDEIDTLLGLERFGGEKLEKAYKDLEGQIMESITDKVFALALNWDGISKNHIDNVLASTASIRPWFKRCDF
jgi:hemerythrin-like domain-containing protein